MSQLRVMGRNTQGVRLANLKDNDYLVAIQKLEGSEQQTSTDGELTAESQGVAIPGIDSSTDSMDASTDNIDSSTDNIDASTDNIDASIDNMDDEQIENASPEDEEE